MSRAAGAVEPHAGLRLLLALRARTLANRVRQTWVESPLQATLVTLFVLSIWVGLYLLFDRIFLTLSMFREQSVIVIPIIFNIFFVAMMVLLGFSSAILAYGGLFTRAEPGWLLTVPLRPRSIVALIHLESIFFASWSLLLLGLPMMIAMGRIEHVPWHFYPLFTAAFFAFVPIPGSLGLLGAWAAAMWMPRSARRLLVVLAGATILGALAWWANVWGQSTADPDRWLDRFLSELHILRSALLPSTWVGNVITQALRGYLGSAGFYLYVTAAHALFLSWLTVGVVARFLQPAFGRAHAASARTVRFGGRLTRTATNVFFCYLPRSMRDLVLKDLRTFLRDPMQWSQLVILLGLLALYLAYLPRMHPGGFDLQWQGLICFLNYGAVVLILSTFTSRFVFPLISLEGRQMWLVGLWPLSRVSVVWAKFDFALAVTAGAAMAVTLLSLNALRLPATLGLVQIAATLSSCVGLCGLAVGLGARLPSYTERSAARIASGLGGTLNLVASMVLVTLSVALMGALCYRGVFEVHTLGRIDAISTGIYMAQVALGFGTGSWAMRIGARHFAQAEF